MVLLKRLPAASLLIFVLFGAPPPTEAVRIQTEDTTLGINGFLGFEYTLMDKLPVVMEGPTGTRTIAPLGGVSNLNLRHLNLLLSVEREKFRSYVNLHSLNLFSTNADRDTFKGSFQIQEAYGEYTFRSGFRVRAGTFLAPFGIYNDRQYLLPVFSSVVLPQIYEPPRNYSEPVVSGEPIVPIRALVPDNGTLMLWGLLLGNAVELKYHFYLSSGEIGPEGIDRDKNMGMGTRVLLSVRSDLKIGGSFYTVNNKDALEGTERLFGADVTLRPFPGGTIESEYVVDWYSARKQRLSYYVLAGYQYRRFNPYLRYDFLKDPEHLLLKRKQERYSAGLAYRFTRNVLLKGEFHHHRILEDSGLPGGLGRFNMFRGAIILIF